MREGEGEQCGQRVSKGTREKERKEGTETEVETERNNERVGDKMEKGPTDFVILLLYKSRSAAQVT